MLRNITKIVTQNLTLCVHSFTALFSKVSESNICFSVRLKYSFVAKQIVKQYRFKLEEGQTTPKTSKCPQIRHRSKQLNLKVN